MLKKRTRGFMLLECLIAVTLLALISAFVLPLFQNMLQNRMRAEKEVSLFIHSENIVENLMAKYNEASGVPSDLHYHDLDIVSLLNALQNASVGDVVEQVFLVREEKLALQIQILERNDSIRCLSHLRLINSTERMDLEFVLSRMGG